MSGSRSMTLQEPVHSLINSYMNNQQQKDHWAHPLSRTSYTASTCKKREVEKGCRKMEEINTKVTIPFPAKTKEAQAIINGILTNATSISFSDKIMITITQNGILAQWVTVPLISDNPTDSDPYFATVKTDDNDDDEEGNGNNDSLLPSIRFQPRTILGAGSSEREMMGQLCASQLASMITTRDPEEQRDLLLGLGLAKISTDRDFFLSIIDLALQVI